MDEGNDAVFMPLQLLMRLMQKKFETVQVRIEINFFYFQLKQNLLTSSSWFSF